MNNLTKEGKIIKEIFFNNSEEIDISKDFFALTYTDRELSNRLVIMDGLIQPKEYHPEGDVLTHTNNVINYIRDKWSYKGHMITTVNNYNELVMAGLLYDFGKVETFNEDDGKITFTGHEKESVKYASYFLGSCGFSYKFTKTVLYLVENHMRIASFINMKENKREKFMKDEHFRLLLKLHEADCMSSNGDLKNLNFILDYLKEKGHYERLHKRNIQKI